VGAGAGLTGEFLGRFRPAAAYRFVEPIPSLEKHLERRFGAAANAKRDPRYEGAEFVTLLDVLEHQQDDRAFLAELAGRMDSGATLIVTVPAGPRLWSEWDVALGHHRRYDRPALRRATDGLPLAIVRLDYLFPELVPLALLRRARLRRTRREGEGVQVEFPDLSPALNELLFRAGSASLRLRRFWPLGTSLLGVLAKR
jgi:hypothetical protein